MLLEYLRKKYMTHVTNRLCTSGNSVYYIRPPGNKEEKRKSFPQSKRIGPQSIRTYRLDA